MSLYSWFVKNISFPVIARRDRLPKLMEYLKKLEESQYWSRERIIEHQFERIKALIIHAYRNTDYYRKKFNDVGFKPETFKDFSEIKKIPTLSKNEIRENLRSLIARNYKSEDLHSAYTGGTTGVKMKFYRDNACLAAKEAALYRFEKWTGWDFGERMGLVWPAQQDYVGHWTRKAKIKNELFGRQVVFPAAIMDEESISNYVNQLMVKKPTMIRAFTSPIYEVARYIRDKEIENIKLKGVITTGEPLYGHQRKTISEAFNCDVFDSYRSREAGALAQECQLHNGMHINAESLYVETVPPEDPQRFEEGIGEIVVTDLLNYGMPLIRYVMDDMGILTDELCACGRSLPLLQNLAGRTSDVFYAPDKTRIAAITLVLYLVDEAPGLLGQVQIIQDRLDHLVIKMTSDPLPSDEIKNYQVKKVKELFGPEMQVSFEIVDNIPKEGSGKYLFTKCILSKDEIR